jgi:hypothetical protein
MRAEFQVGFSLVVKVWQKVSTKDLYEGRLPRGNHIDGKGLVKWVTTTLM